MMKVSLMHQVMQTLNKQWESPLAEEIASCWGYDAGTLKFFRASANFLFVLKRNGQDYFLRFNAASERSLTDISTEIEILNQLQHVQIAKPVPSPQGHYIEVIETVLGTFYAVLFERLPGAQHEFEELQEGQFYAWGQALGHLHHCMQEVSAPNRQDWRVQLEALKESLPAEETAALAEVERVIELAGELPQTQENYGLIHYDFEPDNLRWNGEGIGILDFDDSIRSWYAADIAYALRDLFTDGVDLEHPLLQQFIAGYRSKTALDDSLLAALPLFLRMHKIVLFGKLLRAADLGKDAGRLTGLQNKLLQRVNEYRTAFS